MADTTATAPEAGRPWSAAVLSYGFRPFFLCAALWAALSVALWVAALEGLTGPSSAFDALTWHAHEMVFGFVGAAIGGFLLTAVPNWTGRPPLRGLPLLGLVGLWLAGRVAVGGSAVIGAGPAAVIDLLFPAALLAVVVRELLASRSWRNLPIAVAVGVFLIANALMHAEAAGIATTAAVGWRLGFAVVIMLIVLIGGRIVPNFTRNWLAKQEALRLPAPFGGIDRATLLTTLAAVAAWAVAPETSATAVLAAFAAVLNLVRLARWRGHATLIEPLVSVLHLGYAWIWIGFALVAAGFVVPAVPPVAAVHAFAAGAIATMILAVMTRATLGHTGRPLQASPGTIVLYAAITLAAILRVAASLFLDVYQPLLMAAGVAWLAAFIGYVAIYGPMLVRPRPDGRPG